MESVHCRRLTAWLLALAICAAMLMPAKAEAATVTVQVSGKSYTYSKVIKTLCINGRRKDISDTPVFMRSGAYMGPAGTIFKTMLKLNYNSDLTSVPKRLTLINGKNKLVMKHGSWTGTLNGTGSKMGGPVLYLKYTKIGKYRWVVPIKSVCARLGLEYYVSNGVVYINTVSDSESARSSESNKTETASTTTTSTGTKTTTSTTTQTGKTKNSKKIVLVLDAGHGGSDNGASGYGYKEKNMTLAIVKAAKGYFDKDKHFQVYYTRVTDIYPTLADRYKLANNKKADLFISVHINSYAKTSTGTETLYSKARNTKTKKNGITSFQLATCMQSYAKNATGFYNRGLKNRPNLQVLKYTNMPACLIEYGFLSNKAEAKKMNANLANYGAALYKGVVGLTKNKGLYK